MILITRRCAVALVAGLLVANQAVGQLTFQIFSDANDGFLESRGDTLTDLPPSSPWPVVHPETFGTFQGTVGEWFGAGPDGPDAYGLATIVLPFQLPNFGTVNDPFATADLGVMLNPNTGDSNSTDIDLYGLARVDTDPAILTADWYSGASFDPGATLIQESFLTPSSPQGFVGAPNNNTDAAGDTQLVNFLNASYAGGANADSFVFLRLSYGSDTFASSFDNYNITLREAGQTGEWPVITYSVNAIPGDVNGDGQVTIEDFFDPNDPGQILGNWRETNESFGATLARTDGDLNLDGAVNVADFREWKDAFLANGGSASAVTGALNALTGVPEPSTAAAAFAVLGLLISRGRMARSLS
ncbi:MAG: hypothetical protein AAGJ46_04335 [Planctomycetota bacterium]